MCIQILPKLCPRDSLSSNQRESIYHWEICKREGRGVLAREAKASKNVITENLWIHHFEGATLLSAGRWKVQAAAEETFEAWVAKDYWCLLASADVAPCVKPWHSQPRSKPGIYGWDFCRENSEARAESRPHYCLNKSNLVKALAGWMLEKQSRKLSMLKWNICKEIPGHHRYIPTDCYSIHL